MSISWLVGSNRYLWKPMLVDLEGKRTVSRKRETGADEVPDDESR